MDKVSKNEISLYLNSNAISINDKGVLINQKESEYFLNADKIYMFFGLIMSKANRVLKHYGVSMDLLM